jgi:hypothetical protein
MGGGRGLRVCRVRRGETNYQRSRCDVNSEHSSLPDEGPIYQRYTRYYVGHTSVGVSFLLR